jgi:hypothetical protein
VESPRETEKQNKEERRCCLDDEKRPGADAFVGDALVMKAARIDQTPKIGQNRRFDPARFL